MTKLIDAFGERKATFVRRREMTRWSICWQDCAPLTGRVYNVLPKLCCGKEDSKNRRGALPPHDPRGNIPDLHYSDIRQFARSAQSRITGRREYGDVQEDSLVIAALAV